MAMRDVAHRLKVVQSVATAPHTATVTGSTVDLAQGSGYEAAAFEVDFGAYTDGTHTITFQDSADGTNWNTLANGSGLDVATPAAISSNASQNSVVLYGYYGGNRYIRAISTVAGATTGAVYGINVILGFPHHQPAY